MKTLSTDSAPWGAFEQIRASRPARGRTSARHRPAGRRGQGLCTWD